MHSLHNAYKKAVQELPLELQFAMQHPLVVRADTATVLCTCTWRYQFERCTALNLQQLCLSPLIVLVTIPFGKIRHLMHREFFDEAKSKLSLHSVCGANLST